MNNEIHNIKSYDFFIHTINAMISVSELVVIIVYKFYPFVAYIYFYVDPYNINKSN